MSWGMLPAHEEFKVMIFVDTPLPRPANETLQLKCGVIIFNE